MESDERYRYNKKAWPAGNADARNPIQRNEARQAGKQQEHAIILARNTIDRKPPALVEACPGEKLAKGAERRFPARRAGLARA